ncbi:type VII secretion protein EssA [Terribacillus aidingensis]|uniref:Type VII secretion protein EssA n=1 Tax=Terribacillus aidingensis TaxID=586416 RepID=A0A285NX90_9BACI|nr:type VII secretion protein EssA [Terribacillus aidingensis]SNZ14049.1 type VII secretion protein EssA [Terribacillus aidingensis]
MKTKKKRFDLAFIIIIFLLILPLEVSAESHSEDKNENGSLDLQIDRIQKDKNAVTENKETEKEKKFPNLFKSDTTEEIQQKSEKQKSELEDLQDTIFTLDIDAPTRNEQVQDSLFTSDYTSEAATVLQESDETKEDSGKGVLIFLIGIALVLCVGLYMLMRKLLD